MTWLPWETAPKIHREHVLISCAKNGVILGHFFDTDLEDNWDGQPFKGWEFSELGEDAIDMPLEEVEPNGWMPVPEPRKPS